MNGNNIAYLIPPGYIRCFITENLRKDTPEENVRQRWARSLVEEYGYSKDDMGIEVQIKVGTKRKRCDLVIYRQGTEHIRNNIFVIIEAKRDDIENLNDPQDMHGQLMTYMSACSGCRFGLWVGKERQAYEKVDNRIEVVSDIPRCGEPDPRRPTRHDLKRTHEMKSVFKRCHNYIHVNEGLQKADAFLEMLKLIFCKALDEEEGGDELEFAASPEERRNEAGQRRIKEDRIDPLFQQVCEQYSFFQEDEKIELNPCTVAYVVSELQFLSILDTEIDVKGEAYEELVGSNLRGDRGEYFTPRNVCDTAIRMVMAIHGNDPQRLSRLKVIDCCCGTGGFLVSWLNNLYGLLLDQERRRPGRGDPETRAREKVGTRCRRNLHGLDINPKLVRTCQMNLALHGDGSSNIWRANSVHNSGGWDREVHCSISHGKFDILFTNPPFGGKAKVNDAQVLRGYELRGWERENPLTSIPAEQIFVEAALKFVKPGGYMAMVVPDGIVNNPGLRFIRSWLLRRSRIVASVKLPQTTFEASGGIKHPTLLIVRKFCQAEVEQAQRGVFLEDYRVFMSAPLTSGIKERGKPIYLAHDDGQEMVDNNGKRMRDDEIGGVVNVFQAWLNGQPNI